MKDIRDILFAHYNDQTESNHPADADEAFGDILGSLEDIDTELFSRVAETAQDVIDGQMRMAFMAGFSAGVNAVHVTA